MIYVIAFSIVAAIVVAFHLTKLKSAAESMSEKPVDLEASSKECECGDDCQRGPLGDCLEVKDIVEMPKVIVVSDVDVPVVDINVLPTEVVIEDAPKVNKPKFDPNKGGKTTKHNNSKKPNQSPKIVKGTTSAKGKKSPKITKVTKDTKKKK